MPFHYSSAEQQADSNEVLAGLYRQFFLQVTAWA